MTDPKPKKFKKTTGAPAKGYKWKHDTSGKIPNPAVVPVSPKKIKLKAMDVTVGGSNSAGKGYNKVIKRAKPRSL